MPSPGKVNVVLDVDARPALEHLSDITTSIEASLATTARARHAALERMHRRHLEGAADVFEGARWMRPRLDPRRLLDRWHEHACRRWVARSLAANHDHTPTKENTR